MKLCATLIVVFCFVLIINDGVKEFSLLVLLSLVQFRNWWKCRKQYLAEAAKSQVLDSVMNPNAVAYRWPDCCSCGKFDNHTTNYQRHGFPRLEQLYCIISTIWLRSQKGFNIVDNYLYLPFQTEFEDQDMQRLFVLQLKRNVLTNYVHVYKYFNTACLNFNLKYFYSCLMLQQRYNAIT